MNDKAGGDRGPRRAGVLAVAAAVAALATACGGGAVPPSASPASGRSANFERELALAQCMRSHGAPNFPDPSASGGFDVTTTPNGPKGAIDIDSSQIQAAYGACRHLLAGGGPNISQLRQKLRRQRQQALPALLKFARCMRSHGVPNFPDPTPDGVNPTPLEDAGVSPKSPQFQTAARACGHVAPGVVHISAGTRVG